MKSAIKLDERSRQLRRDVIELSGANGGYHYGGCFSAVEIMRVLFDDVMGPDDKFILSKGHACWPLYVLLREQGLNPKLEGHPSRDPQNGIHATTGSLGHGLPVAIGMAKARAMQGLPGKIYVLMGDGECQEGTTWESMLIAAQLKLDNLVVIVDWNTIQGGGFVENIVKLPDMADIASQIGWHALEVDGHSIRKLSEIFLFYVTPEEPILVQAYTVKGAGVSFMENKPSWHAQWLDPDHKAKALEELA